VRAEGAKQGPLLLPQLTTIGANLAGNLSVVLSGPLKTSQLRGRLSIGSDGIIPKTMTLAKSVRDAGFRLMVDLDEPSVFELLSKSGAALPLPDGEILQMQVSVGDLQPGLYPVTLTIDTLVPRAIFWPGESVVVVPRP
jgi:hypothetical protein